MTRLAIHGAAGRMGRRLVALGHEDPALTVVGAVDAPSHPDAGADAGQLAGVGRLGVPLAGELAGGAEVAGVTAHSPDPREDAPLPFGDGVRIRAQALPELLEVAGVGTVEVPHRNGSAHSTGRSASFQAPTPPSRTCAFM